MIPLLIACFTGTPRYRVAPEWDAHCWTHNIFRLWEWIAGRRAGIRAEISTTITAAGEISQQAHSAEAWCVLAEHVVRAWLGRWSRVRVRLLRPQTSGLPWVWNPWCFAIAWDNNIDVGTGSSSSLSATLVIGAGSNRALCGATRNGGTNTSYVTGMSFNSVAGTEVGANGNSGASQPCTFWYLNAPASGSHTLAFSSGGGTGWSAVATSFSGVSQSGQPEAQNTTYVGTGGNATLFNPSVTTIANNAWLVFGAANSAGLSFTVTSGNGETGSNLATDGNGVGICSRGPMSPAGSNNISMTFTGNGTGNVVPGIVVSLAPFVAGGSLFLPPNLCLGAGGPFFVNPIG